MGWNYPTHLNRAYSENQWTKQAGIASLDSQYISVEVYKV